MILTHEQPIGKVLVDSVRQMELFVAKCGRQGRRLDEVERGLITRLLRLGRELLQTYVEQVGDGDEGETLTRGGKRLRRSGDLHEKPYRSVFGPLTIRRYVYLTREKQKIEAAPLDQRLGLPAEEYSYVVQDWVGRLAQGMPYGEAVDWLEEWLGLKTTVRAAETIVAKLGESVESFQASRPPAATASASEGDILVVTADGKGVPMRRSLEQRLEEEHGKRPHKRPSKRTYEKATKRRVRGNQSSRKQMAYVGAVYGIERWKRRPKDILDEVHHKASEEGRPKPQNKRLWAEMTRVLPKHVCLGGPRLFGHLAAEVAARDPKDKKVVVCMMDGQQTLWDWKETYLPRATGILDIFHVTEKLWKAAYSFYPEGSADAEAFVDHYLKMLLEGKVWCVIGVFRRFLSKVDGRKRAGLQKAIDYFEANRDAMRYDEYLAAGYPIGSGVVEGACRHVVKDRMERTGMRWEIEGAEPILHLRTICLNNEWSAFIQHRIQTEQTRQYTTVA